MALLLIVQVGLLAYSATQQSPTYNEPAHLAAGLSHWEFAHFDLYRVNPPLVRMVAAVPVLFSQPVYDWSRFQDAPWSRSEFAIGRDFVTSNPGRIELFFTMARWMCLPLVLLGGLYCYRWASALYGHASGLLALTCWVISPTVLGHGQLLTPDCAAASTGLMAAWHFRQWLHRPDIIRLIAAGGSLGLALLCKSTWIVLTALFPLLWIWCRVVFRRPTEWSREILPLLGIVGLGVLVLNAGYRFDRTGRHLGDFQFVSQALSGTPVQDGHWGNRFRGGALQHVPVPLPAAYVCGLDVQRRECEAFGHRSYLAGEFRSVGWWYYYLYALLVKTPLGSLALLLLAVWGAVLRVTDCLPRIDRAVLLLIPGTLLFLVSSQTGMNHHMRYVLPVLPFVYVWIGGVITWRSCHRWKRLVSRAASSLVAASVVSVLATYPHSLSYFNEIVGGARGGHRHLLHSNLDWGQDLYRLKNWVAANPGNRPLSLCYYGFVDPLDVGVHLPAAPPNRQHDPHFRPPNGWYAVSVNYLMGYEGRFGPGLFDYFRRSAPVANAGYSIWIYRFDDGERPVPER